MNLHELKRGKKDSIKSFIESKYTERNNSLSPRLRSMMVNLAWVRGFQNVDYSLVQRKFIRNEEKRLRVTTNRMLPIVRRIVSRLTSSAPIWEVLPATSEQEDIEIASLATKILRNEWILQDMDSIQVETAFWMATTCSAFQKIGWDISRGSSRTIPSNTVDQDILNQFMEIYGIESKPRDIEVQEGDLFIDVLTPFNLTFEDNITQFKDALWCIEHQIRPLDWYIDQFGTKIKEKISEKQHIDAFVYPFVHGNINHSDKRKGVLSHELFIKKSSQHPEGLHCLLVDGEFLIKPGKLPFDHGELPYSQFREIFDGSLYGTCSSEQMRGQQALYNDLKTSVAKHAALMGNLQWLNPRQANAGPFTNKPGGIIDYDLRAQGARPEPVKPPNLPAYIENLLNRVTIDIQDIASSHEVTEGKAEPGIRSGKAVLALQEADDNILAPVARLWDASMQRTGRLILQTIAQYTDYEKYVTVTGHFNEQESITYNGLSLIGANENGDYFKVRTNTSGRQYLSRGSRESIIRTVFEIGLIDPKDKDLILHFLGTTDVMTMFDQDQSARARQWRELQIMLEGNQEVVISPGEKHRAHIQVIDKFINSDKWDGLDTNIRGYIVQHREQHIIEFSKDLIKEQIYAQAAAQSIVGPGDPGQSGSGGRTGNPAAGATGPAGAAGPAGA